MNEETNPLPKLPTGEEMESKQAGLDFLPGDNWQGMDIDRYMLDFTKQYTPPKFTLSWDGIPFAPLGGIHNITGQAGNGKTMTIAQFMAAILAGKCGKLRYELKDIITNPSVLYIDTEQEEDNTIAEKNRVLTMAGREVGQDYDDFHIIMLRDIDDVPVLDANGKQAFDKNGRPIFLNAAVARWRAVLKALWKYRPTVCFIDGLLDVVADFNDNIECQELIFKCMKTAAHYQMSLWCILHQNPGGEKLVGHLGSFLERKVTDVIQTKKVKDPSSGDIYFEVKQKKARSRDFNDWKFRVLPINSWGEPEQIVPAEPTPAYTTDQIREWLTIYQSDVEWPATQTEIKTKIFKEKCGIKNNDKLQECVKMAFNRRFIIPQSKDEYAEGQKHPKYKLNRDEIKEEPF